MKLKKLCFLSTANKQQSQDLKPSFFYQSARKRQTTQLKRKMGKDFNGISQEGPQVDNKHLKMCLISFYIRKMKIQMIMKYHGTSTTRMKNLKD